MKTFFLIMVDIATHIVGRILLVEIAHMHRLVVFVAYEFKVVERRRISK